MKVTTLVGRSSLPVRCTFIFMPCICRGHAHEGDAVAVVGVHVGLHLEHHAGKLVFGLDGLFSRWRFTSV
jgi:hypothetical protein